jgi:NAD(P)-dependent dehydrogenase (short-subunit alcohol dehydrogenase family)
MVCSFDAQKKLGHEAMLIEGKVAVISGGAFGIGRAAARKFVQLGGKVVVADINVSG